MRPIIGIDPSSKKLAFCLTEGASSPVFYKKSLPEGVLHAAGDAFEGAFLFFLKHEDAKVFMEAPLVGRSAYSTIIQAQVGGAVLAAASKAKLPVELVNVSSWKKQVIGNGRAQKPDIQEWLRKNWPDAYNHAQGDQDLMDAAAINRYGYQHVRLTDAIVRKATRGKKVARQENYS